MSHRSLLKNLVYFVSTNQYRFDESVAAYCGESVCLKFLFSGLSGKKQKESDKKSSQK